MRLDIGCYNLFVIILRISSFSSFAIYVFRNKEEEKEEQGATRSRRDSRRNCGQKGKKD